MIAVHLGFLQINHRYLIDLRLPGNLFKCNNIETIKLIPDDNSVPNLHCRLVEIENKTISVSLTDDQKLSASDKKLNATNEISDTNKSIVIDYHDIKVEYFAHREKLLREELKVINANNKEELLKLILTARVLGKGKGTPMLRNGIHCIGVEMDEESEQSDAQGTSSTSFSRAH